MSDKPRRWFQFHLSTAVLLMLAIGFDLCLWTHTTRIYEYLSLDSMEIGYSNDFGFPISFYWTKKFAWNDTRTLMAILANLPFNAGPLLVLALACEWFIRRREDRTP